MRQELIHDGWTVESIGATPAGFVVPAVPALVPGCVHLDLVAAGIIDHPYRNAVESEVSWMFEVDWRYRTAVTGPAVMPAARDRGERLDLVFDGIDTVATVSVNGSPLGRSLNMHRSYRYDVTDLWTGGPTELAVDITSVTRYGEAERSRLGDRPAVTSGPFPFVRKMASSFGWDWGPDLRTAGLWRPVRLVRWETARFDRVRPLVTVTDGTGRVDVEVTLARVSPVDLLVTADILGRHVEVDVPAGEDTVSCHLEIPDPPLWWPAGYGAHPLCDLTLTLTSGKRELDRWSRRVGFRTVRVDTTPDEHGTPFVVQVNGAPIFVKGANWIPDDHFLPSITPERIGRRLDQATAAHLNLLRVWGGGVFESDDFYDACDERGLLVWQDFLLACAAYPEEAPLWEEIEAEARENIVRMMPHPSLAIYNGGNENLWLHERLHWSPALDGRTWGQRYALELFPRLTAELDPTRPYAANSPYSPRLTAAQANPNDPDHGTHHQWEVWNEVAWTHYRSEIPRFTSEFGFQAPPTWRTLTEWVAAADGRPLAEVVDFIDDANLLVHQKAADGMRKLTRGMAWYTDVPTDFDDWVWAAQLNQARAVAYGIDHYRSWWPRTAGAIVWQLNDCWPVTSWAAIDYGERPKPLWHAMRAAFAPRRLVVTSDPSDPSELILALVNDTDDPWLGEVALRREQFDGTPIATSSQAVAVAARSVHRLAVDPAIGNPSDATREIIVAELEGCVAVHTFAPDRELDFDPDPLSVRVEAQPDGYLVDVRAHSFAKDITWCVDRLAADASVDDSMVTLPAGGTARFRIRTAVTELAGQLTSRPVLRTANDLADRLPRRGRAVATMGDDTKSANRD